MQLASFAVATDVGAIRRVGVVQDGDLLDVTAGYAHILDQQGGATPTEVAQTVAPPDMTTFLRRGERAMDAAREVAETVPDADTEHGPDGARLTYNENEVELLSPLPRPNTLRDFMAFEEHVENTMGEVPDIWYEIPVGYKSNPESVVGHGAEVEWPDYSDQLDIELEIAAVIGREGRNIDAGEADEYIAGYTIFNDFSARDTQLEEMQGQLGPAKGKDFANALGPYLVTPGEFDLPSASFTAEVDGEVWSEGTVGEMGHSFAEIIEHASDHETLKPGDVLGSGTVGTGCGLELGKFLDDGDTTKLTVEGLGTLTNTVVQS